MTTGTALGRTYIQDCKTADISELSADMSADIYYEVVRLIGHKFLFLDDHLDRLENSMKGSNLTYPGKDTIKKSLRLLLLNNDEAVGNIRICVQSSQGANQSLLCYFVPYFYPDECMYKSGVQLASYPHERPNPGIKKWDDRFRKKVNEFIRDHGIYEAILMNFQHELTEGSRSNIFFIDQENRLITPPIEEILPGITRKYVLQICKEEQIEVHEEPLLLKELDQMDSCFISGTSPKVLPVWQLDGFQFNTDHPILQLVMERFDTVIKENLVSLT